jgi:sirohydrochlorin ferrochelatase
VAKYADGPKSMHMVSGYREAKKAGLLPLIEQASPTESRAAAEKTAAENAGREAELAHLRQLIPDLPERARKLREQGIATADVIALLRSEAEDREALLKSEAEHRKRCIAALTQANHEQSKPQFSNYRLQKFDVPGAP